MLRIKPIPEENASAQVKQVYDDVKKTLDTPVVPLIFQYIANFEEYLVYQWSKIKANIESPYFQNSVSEAIAFAQKEVAEIYAPSLKMTQFIQRLSPEEKQQLIKTTNGLQQLNAKLLILTIGLREGVKGVIIGQEKLQQLDVRQYEVDIFDIFHTKYDNEERGIEPASRMLAPLFGSTSIMISQYPAFFAQVAGEMEALVKGERYLQKRVLLEQKSMKEAFGLPFTLGTSYQEIMAYAGHRPHLNELIYIFAETFPSQFPRLLMTTVVMQLALSGKSPLVTR